MVIYLKTHGIALKVAVDVQVTFNDNDVQPAST